VPGDDIVGFEHAARTQAQRSAINAAKIKLSAPLQLFALPAAASCTVTKANVVIEAGEQATKAKSAAKPASTTMRMSIPSFVGL
jgi:hypothetical protein